MSDAKSPPPGDASQPDPAFGRDAVAGPWSRRSDREQTHRGGRSTFVWLLAITQLGVLPLAIALGMHWWLAALMALGIMAITAGVLALVMALLWRPWAHRHPDRPAAPGAEVRLFQFVSLGALGGFNGCVEIASDEKQVRLALMPPFGWFFAPPIALPRAQMVLVRPARMKGLSDAVVVRIGDRHVTLPRWTVPELV